RIRVAVFVAGVLAYLTLGNGARAQSVTATLVGTVFDASNAAVPQVRISLTNKGTNVMRTVVGNEQGNYIIPNLAPGFYRLVTEHEGFRRTVVGEFELLVNQTARVDVVLQVGTVAETVEVTAIAPLVESETSSVGQVVQRNFISDLPLKGRAVFELALLSPATVPTNPSSYIASVRPMPGGVSVPAFSAAGGRDNNNGYLVDGVDAMDPIYMTPSMYPSMDSIQEFKVQTNSYSAEFGHFSVQVNASTRAGTNQLHGSLHNFLRNEALDAANFFDNFAGLRKAPLRYNLFGGTLGGPVRVPRLYNGRDRTFFFVSYEGTRIRTSRTAQLSVPTPQQRDGDFSNLGYRGNQPIFDPSTTRPNPTGAGVVRDPFVNNMIAASRITAFAQQALGLYPLPTSTAAVGNNFFTTLGDSSDNNQLVSRVDHILSDKTSLAFRYYFFDGLRTSHSAIQNGGENRTARTQNAVLSLTHSFSPNTLNELRLGYNRPIYYILQDGAYGTNYAPIFGFKNLLNEPIAYGIPNISLTNFSGYGLVADPNGQLTNLYQIIDHMTLIRGGHNLKFGADLRKTNYNDRGYRNARGSVSFTGALTADPQNRGRTGVSLADMLLGLPLTANGSPTPLAGNFNNFGYYFFLQDDWKISSRLTLNLGLRYELDTRFTEVQNRQSYFDRSYPGCRLLLAGSSKAFIPPFNIIDGPAISRGLFAADTNNWGPRVGLAFRPFDSNRTAIRAGYGIFYTMVDGQTQRQLERNPPVSTVVSVSANQDANANGPDAIRVSELFPARGSPTARPQIYTNIGYSPLPYVQQWNLTIQQSLTANTLLEFGYIGSKGTHMVLYAQGNQAPLDADPSRPTSLVSRQPFPLWGAEMRTTMNVGNSSYNAGFVKLERRLSHGLSLLAHYTFSKDLSMISDINEAAVNFLNPEIDKGRSINDIRHYAVTAVTWDLPVGPGRPYLTSGPLSRILGDWRANSIISMHGGFPFTAYALGDVCNCGLAGLGEGSDERAQQVGDPRSGFTQSRVQWFNTAAFVQPRQGTMGNSGKNILTGPGAANVQFSIFRIISLREKARLQIRSEFFNLFNRVNFGNPGTTVGTTNYGVITSAADARIIQFALKFQF
ncbi:MAG: TonB-dependent receptor, partial [Acidobacteria bacterium]|nr:TonB-dependent receptor [Acidobacteriota bacterium]